MIAQALEIAARVHKGQVDKGGTEYIFHVLTVMQWSRDEARFTSFGSPDFIRDVTVIAILHDVLEDFDGTPTERLQLVRLLQEAFTPEINEAVLALTKAPGEPYEAYIERVAPNIRARFVKVRDLRHNMDTTRLPTADITEKDYLRWDRYRKTLVRLEREA